MEKDFMDENQPLEEASVQEQPAYVPRPRWQLVAAWIGLILFLLVIAGYYINIARGGL